MPTYSIHDFVTISADHPLPIPDWFIVDQYFDSNSDIIVKTDTIDYCTKSYSSVGDNYLWDRMKRSLIVDWGYGVRAELMDLSGNANVRISPLYRRAADYHYLIRSILRYRLLAKNVAFVFGSGIRDPNGDGVLIIGWRNMGKTSTALTLSQLPNTAFLGDDVVLIHNDEAYAFPKAVGLSPHTVIPQGKISMRKRIERYFRSMCSAIPFSEALSSVPESKASVPAKRFANLTATAPINYCFFLYPDEEETVKELPPSEAARRTIFASMSISDTKNTYHHLVNTYFYLSDIKTEAVFGSHNSVLTKALSDADAIQLSVPKDQYVEKIVDRAGW